MGDGGGSSSLSFTSCTQFYLLFCFIFLLGHAPAPVLVHVLVLDFVLGAIFAFDLVPSRKLVLFLFCVLGTPVVTATLQLPPTALEFFDFTLLHLG